MHIRGEYDGSVRCDVGTLIDRCKELPENATFIMPFANKRFQVTDVQQQ